MPTTLTPQEFVNKWRGSTSTERQAYQQHFIDLCHLVGHPTPAELDPENKFFTFEAGATKQSGGNGFADVWYKDHFAIEYKGPDGNLSKAYNQLLQYRESLENPPLLIVSNLPDHQHPHQLHQLRQRHRSDHPGRLVDAPGVAAASLHLL